MNMCLLYVNDPQFSISRSNKCYLNHRSEKCVYISENKGKFITMVDAAMLLYGVVSVLFLHPLEKG